MLCSATIKNKDGQNVICNKKFPEKFIKNRVSLFLRQLLEFYYQGKSNPINFLKVATFVLSPVAIRRRVNYSLMVAA